VRLRVAASDFGRGKKNDSFQDHAAPRRGRAPDPGKGAATA
jgi:hypothetical protein